MSACAHCGQTAAECGKKLMKCGRCSAAVYCGRKCQLAAWPKHKAECGGRPVPRRKEKAKQKEEFYGPNGIMTKMSQLLGTPAPDDPSKPPIEWPADAAADARDPVNTAYGRKVNTEGVYAAMAKTERKKLTRSIFGKWNARGGLQSPCMQKLDPAKPMSQDNIQWVSLACQIIDCAEYDGDWADGLTDEEIALVMDPEWRRKEALPHFVAESPALGEFLDKRLKAWGF